MFGTRTTFSSASRDMHTMITEAEKMLSDASTATGEKASELQKKGIDLLSSSLSKAHELERLALTSVRDIATSTDDMVHANPWRSMAASGLVGLGVGIALGIALSRD